MNVGQMLARSIREVASLLRPPPALIALRGIGNPPSFFVSSFSKKKRLPLLRKFIPRIPSRMKYNQLGRTSVFVSEICLGAMTFGGNADAGMWKAIGALGQAAVDGIISRVLAAGLNFIDTADVYSFGQFLKNLGANRKDVIIATKVFGEVGPGSNDHGASRGHIMDAVQGSRSASACAADPVNDREGAGQRATSGHRMKERSPLYAESFMLKYRAI
jgi:hypothetical protein